jgi:hypothetical protein
MSTNYKTGICKIIHGFLNNTIIKCSPANNKQTLLQKIFTAQSCSEGFSIFLQLIKLHHYSGRQNIQKCIKLQAATYLH